MKRAVAGLVVGASVSLAMASGSLAYVLSSARGDELPLRATVSVCAFDRRWYPLYPKVVHARGCSNPDLTADTAVQPTITASAERTSGYWLDHFNALIYLGTVRADQEFKEMAESGANTVMIHADSLPTPMLQWLAWRAKQAAGLRAVAWIQRPTRATLLKATRLNGYTAVQVDDHYFADPPLNLQSIRQRLGNKQLWCSFQPGQFNQEIAAGCDHSDVQFYRQTCPEIVRQAASYGLLRRSSMAVSVYADGGADGNELVQYVTERLKPLGGQVFVFKWKNQEIWSKPFWALLSRVAHRS